MSSASHNLTWTATRDDYEREATVLYNALQARDNAALWNFKWMHPHFRGKTVTDVDPSRLDIDDARLVIAHEYGFPAWFNLMKFADEIAEGGRAAQFERAVDAVVSGDVSTLQAMIRDDPLLVHRRSARFHRATLLHYIAANGVENVRQKTPPNALDVARTLLDAGAEPDALAMMYDNLCTTMSMLVSSAHPADAGLQADLAELLLDYGAKHHGPGSEWQSDIMTALAFGYWKTADRLARRGAPTDSLPAVAGLGRATETSQLLPSADSRSRHIALALAAQHGHADVVRLLLDAGEDPNQFCPEGFHAHATPLHNAISAGRDNVVRLLLDRGARTDIRDTVFDGTPLDWAVYCKRPEIEAELRRRGAPASGEA
jgi:ankyrin repeat protein